MKNNFNNIYLDEKNLSKKTNNIHLDLGPPQIKLSILSSHKSLSSNKYNNDKENNFFISKTRRINKYNPKNLINPRELIIDTRNDSNNLFNSKKNKFNYVEYRHQKYQTYRIPLKIKSASKSYEKNLNYYYQNFSNDTYSINEENLPLKTKLMNFKNKAINRPINGYIPKFSLTYNHLPHRPVGNSLYTILAMRKNQFMDAFNEAKEKERKEISKLKQMKFIKYNKTPLSNYLENKKDYTKQIDLLNQPFSYISLLNDDYSISEKIRFQKMMDQLIMVKKCIKDNPDQEFEIVKEYLLSIGIYKLSNFDVEKINNFINFIKKDILIDPTKNIKENVIDILNKKKINKPLISNALDCLNEEYLFNEMRKRKKLLKQKKIGEYFNSWNNIINTSDKDNSEKNKEILIINERNKFNEHLKSKSIENKYQQKTLEHKGICLDMKRQQEIELSNKKKDLDIINNPKVVIDIIENDLKNDYKEKIWSKTNYNWNKNLNKNKRLYGLQKDKIDYKEAKKKNKLTEYFCLKKAKDNMKFDKLKKKYKIS